MKKKENNKFGVFPYRSCKVIRNLHKTIWPKIEDLVLPVHDNRYIKTKIKTYEDKVYTNFGGIHVSKNDAEYEPFAMTSINSLLVHEKK